jgi:hypothetical protein
MFQVVNDEKYSNQIQQFNEWRDKNYKDFNIWAAQHGARPLILNSGASAKVS